MSETKGVSEGPSPGVEGLHSTAHSARFLLFSDCTLDLAGGRLLRDGEEIPLRPKSFAVLEYLVDRAGRLVSRDELLSAVWPGTFVTDDSLTHCIADIRKALGDQGEEVIHTVPRRGYVFSALVKETAALRGDVLAATQLEKGGNGNATPSTSARLRLKLAIASVALLLAVAVGWWITRDEPVRGDPVTAQAPPNSIAVLRFADMSPDGDQAHLADGLAEEILHALAQVPELLVIARTSSFAVEGESLVTSAAKLNVAHVLEGSVRRSGDRIRVIAQLVDATAGTHRWSEVYERQLDDLFDVQAEIAGAVASALHVTLVGDTVQASASPPDPRAYELFLRGRFFYSRRAQGDLERARELYEQALAIDPALARAWVGLAAICHLQRGTRWNDIAGLETRLGTDDARYQEIVERERMAVEEAIMLDPGLPEANMRAGGYHWYNGDRDTAHAYFERARALDPDHPLVLGGMATTLAWGSRLDEAIATWQRAALRDPLGHVTRTNLAETLLWANRLDEAMAEYQDILALGRGISRGAGRVDDAVLSVGRILLLEHRLDDAVEWIDPWPAGSDRDYGLAMLYHALGDSAGSDAAMKRLVGRAEASDLLPIAEAYAYRGDFDAALTSLHRIGSHDGCRNRAVMAAFHSPFLGLMREDPRWQAWRTETEGTMRECGPTREWSSADLAPALLAGGSLRSLLPVALEPA